jgi:hypothetical protein
VGTSLRWGMLGALAAGVGALLWAVKSVAILVTGDQPPMLYELAPACFAVGVLLLALDLPVAVEGTHRSRLPGIALGGAATAAGVLGAGAEVAGQSTASGALLGACVAAASAAAAVCARPWPWRAQPGAEVLAVRRAAVGTALVLLPAFVLMGVLASFGERLIEVGLLVVAASWGWLAACLQRAAR